MRFLSVSLSYDFCDILKVIYSLFMKQQKRFFPLISYIFVNFIFFYLKLVNPMQVQC